MSYESRYGWGKLPHPTSGTTIDLTGRPAVVYRIYGKNSRLLYVGCSVRPDTRIRYSAGMARYQSGRPLTAVKVEHYATYEQAATVEAWAIKNERPALNRKRGRALLDLCDCTPVRVEWLDGDLVPVSDSSGASIEVAAAAADLERAQARFDRAIAAADQFAALERKQAS